MERLTNRSLVGVVCLAAVASIVARPAWAGEEASVPKATLPLIVYDNANTEGEVPFIPSGWMGNTEAIQFDDGCTDKPRSGDSCIKVTYDAAGKWGGIVWQSPADDWGEEPGGYNLTGARKLTFWARGEKGGEMVEFKAGIYPKSKPYYDTASVSLGKVKLSTDWKSYSIDLTGKNLERIKSGFVFSVAGKKDPITFYLDDIQYE
jgi:hypothetical protein